MNNEAICSKYLPLGRKVIQCTDGKYNCLLENNVNCKVNAFFPKWAGSASPFENLEKKNSRSSD